MRIILTTLFLLAILSGNTNAINIEKETAANLKFVQEKTGSVETDFQKKITATLIGFPNIKSAYLVLVNYGSAKKASTALCIEQSESGNEQTIVEAIGKIFAQSFSSSEHLDFLFINHVQKEQIDKIAKPFYIKK